MEGKYRNTCSVLSVGAFLFLFLFSGPLLKAQSKVEYKELQEKTQVFQYRSEVGELDIKVPTVVDVHVITEKFPSIEKAVVYDSTAREFLPTRTQSLGRSNSRITESVNTFRFLAKPEHKYQIFYGADRAPAIQLGEKPNLEKDKGVQNVGERALLSNPYYQPPDRDQDKIPNREDNCPAIKNPKQTDKNQNGKGDACEDFDRDGIINANDNCRSTPNKAQKDVDNDGKGDVCDETDNRIFEGNQWLSWAVLGGVAVILLGMLGWFLVSMNATSSEEDI